MTDEPLEAQIERLLSPHAPVVRETARALRQVIREEFGGVAESVDFGNKLIAFGRSMKMRDLTFAVIPHTAHVNLQLADGVDLPNPDGLIEGTGKRIRHVKVRSAEQAVGPRIRGIVRAQIDIRRSSDQA